MKSEDMDIKFEAAMSDPDVLRVSCAKRSRIDWPFKDMAVGQTIRMFPDTAKARRAAGSVGKASGMKFVSKRDWPLLIVTRIE